MNRRSLLKLSTLFGVSQLAFVARNAEAQAVANPIVLHCDLAVDPKREQEMLNHFHRDFKPAAMKHPGYIDVKMLKIRKIMQGGPGPAKGVNYRFQLTFKNEELRQKWINSAIHQEKWGQIEATFLDKNFLVLLTDSV